MSTRRRRSQRAVDAIPDIPAEVERLTVTEFEPVLPVIMINAFSEADEIVRADLKDIERDLAGCLEWAGSS